MPLPLSGTVTTKLRSPIVQRTSQWVAPLCLMTLLTASRRIRVSCMKHARRQHLLSRLGRVVPARLDLRLAAAGRWSRRASRRARRRGAPACRPGRAPTAASPRAPRARAAACASLSLVWTIVSSLAPRSSCRSEAMRLRSRSVNCSTRCAVSCSTRLPRSRPSAAAARRRGGCGRPRSRAARARTSGTGACRPRRTAAAGRRSAIENGGISSTPRCTAELGDQRQLAGGDASAIGPKSCGRWRHVTTR